MVKVLLMSIKPKYSHKIYSGKKRTELRKTRPNAAPGDVVVIYETTPVKAITGLFTIDYISQYSCPENYVEAAVKRAAVTQKEYLEYVNNSNKIVFIDIGAVEMVRRIPLEKLRRIESFSVPISYRYLSEKEYQIIYSLMAGIDQFARIEGFNNG